MRTPRNIYPKASAEKSSANNALNHMPISTN